jgi:hypothetical protein
MRKFIQKIKNVFIRSDGAIRGHLNVEEIIGVVCTAIAAGATAQGILAAIANDINNIVSPPMHPSPSPQSSSWTGSTPG